MDALHSARMPRVRTLAVLLPLALALAAACSSGGGAGSGPIGGDAAIDALTDGGSLVDVYEQTIDAPCLVQVANPPIEGYTHVPIGTIVDYGTNPPSSGNHYPIWAAFQAYTSPVPREYYVHDLEHGAIDLLYTCSDPAGCPQVAAALQAISDALPDDPLCDGEGVRVRTVITPTRSSTCPLRPPRGGGRIAQSASIHPRCSRSPWPTTGKGERCSAPPGRRASETPTF